MNGEMIDKLYAKELIPIPIAEFESLSDEEKKLHKPYPFDPHTHEAGPGIVCDQDTAVEMRDGTGVEQPVTILNGAAPRRMGQDARIVPRA